MVQIPVNRRDLDDGIRDTVVLLWKAGFRTFASYEGERGGIAKNGNRILMEL